MPVILYKYIHCALLSLKTGNLLWLLHFFPSSLLWRFIILMALNRTLQNNPMALLTCLVASWLATWAFTLISYFFTVWKWRHGCSITFFGNKIIQSAFRKLPLPRKQSIERLYFKSTTQFCAQSYQGTGMVLPVTLLLFFLGIEKYMSWHIRRKSIKHDEYQHNNNT